MLGGNEHWNDNYLSEYSLCNDILHITKHSDSQTQTDFKSESHNFVKNTQIDFAIRSTAKPGDVETIMVSTGIEPYDPAPETSPKKSTSVVTVKIVK